MLAMQLALRKDTRCAIPFLLAVHFILLATLTACGGGGVGGQQQPPPAPVLQSIVVGLNTATVTIGDQQQLTVTGNYSDGSNRDLTAGATFSSSDETVATVSASGLVDTVGVGEATITATANGRNGNSILTVLAVLLADAGQDQSLVIGESMLVAGNAVAAEGATTYDWILLEKPANSQLSIADSSASSQFMRPDEVGDYVLELTVSDDFRTSDPGQVRLTALAVPALPVPVIAVLDVEFTDSVNTFVDSTSAIKVFFEGPVDSATLTSPNVRIINLSLPANEEVPADLLFDADDQMLTITPTSPLPFDSAFRLEISGLGSTENPFDFTPTSRVFVTPEQEFGIVEGLVLDPDGAPLLAVKASIAGLETITDEEGYFYLEDVPLGIQDLDIDPEFINGDIVYTPMHYLLEVEAGATPNTVGRPIYLAAIDTTTAIDFPNETVLSSPQLPGLVIDFSDSYILDPSTGGNYVGPITLSPVVPTNVPMPFPGASSQFWTIQPGGLTIIAPATITVPLPIQMDPGAEIDLWAFNHATNVWENYGVGTVNADGQTATSNAEQGLPFTGWHGVVTRLEVTRPLSSFASNPSPSPKPSEQKVAGSAAVITVKDSDDHPLHGVLVDVPGGGEAYSDYTGDGEAAVFSGSVQGAVQVSQVLVGYNVNVNNTFDTFDPYNPELCATARTLNSRVIYRECVELDVSSLADTSVLDGGLPAELLPPEFKFADYYVVDPDDDTINLHRDIKPKRRGEAKRDHIIKTRGRRDPDMIRDSDRYKAEVKAVTAKLSNLGFHEDDCPVTPLDSAGEDVYRKYHKRAVYLFQSLYFTDNENVTFKNRCDRTRRNCQGGRGGDVDGAVGGGTIRALNSYDTGDRIWGSNSDYAVNTTLQRNTVNRFGHASSINKQVGALISSGDAASIHITAVTPPTGGYRFSSSATCTGSISRYEHWAGSEVDIKQLNASKNPAGGGYFYDSVPAGRTGRVHKMLAPGTPHPDDEKRRS